MTGRMQSTTTRSAQYVLQLNKPEDQKEEKKMRRRQSIGPGGMLNMLLRSMRYK